MSWYGTDLDWLSVMTPDHAQAVVNHFPMVRRMARAIARSLPSHVDLEDLVGAGAVGLVNAALRFDPSRAAFEDYAAIRVRGAMRDYLRGLDWMTRTHRRRARLVDHAATRLWRERNQPPADSEVAEHLGWTTDQVDWSRASFQVLHVDTRQLDDLAAEAVSPATFVEAREDLARLRRAFACLSTREREVLSLYYVEEMTLRAIGEHFGVTESRACQVHRGALARLRVAFAKASTTQLAA